MTERVERLPLSLRAGWGVGSMVTTTLIFTTNTFFLHYMTDYVGLSAVIAGSLLAATKFIDAVLNPLAGVISDNVRTRFGRRRPFLLLGSLLGALALVLMFSVPGGLGASATSAYVFGALVLTSIAYVSFNVPYLAMIAEMTDSVTERAVLVSFRVYALAAAQFIAGGCAPLLIDWFGGDRGAYGSMAVVLGLFIALIGITCFVATRKARATKLGTAAKGNFWRSLPTLFRSRLFTAVVLVKATFLIGSTAHTATAAYYVTSVLGGGGPMLSLFLLAYSLGMVVSQPAWLFVIARVGKLAAFFGAAGIYTTISIAWLLLDPGTPLPLIVALSFVNGTGAGGLLLSSESLLPDAIEDDFRLSGIRREGTLVSLFAFAEKVSNGIGISLVGAALSWFGYAGRNEGQPVDSQSLHAILVGFGWIPAIFVGASGLWWLLIAGRRGSAKLSD